MKLLAPLFGIAALVASPALAQTGSAEFVAAGNSYTVDVPAGYCSKGPQIDIYLERQRETMPGNVPEVVMMPCGKPDNGSINMITITFRPKFGVENSLDEVLGELRRTFPAVQGQELGKQAENDMKIGIGERLAGRVKVDTGIKALGVDDVCAYVGGRISVEVDGKGAFETVGAGCLTVIDGRVFQISRYESGMDPAKVAESVPTVKRVAMSIRPRRK